MLADAMDVLKRNFHALVGWNIHACDAGHVFALLSLCCGLAWCRQLVFQSAIALPQ
jgi:hypothetical protein